MRRASPAELAERKPKHPEDVSPSMLFQGVLLNTFKTAGNFVLKGILT
jgi:hypothetical protein